MKLVLCAVLAMSISQSTFAACGMVLLLDAQSLGRCLDEIETRVKGQAADIDRLRGKVNVLEAQIELQSRQMTTAALKNSNYEEDIRRLQTELLDLKLNLPTAPKRR